SLYAQAAPGGSGRAYPLVIAPRWRNVIERSFSISGQPKSTSFASALGTLPSWIAKNSSVLSTGFAELNQSLTSSWAPHDLTTCPSLTIQPRPPSATATASSRAASSPNSAGCFVDQCSPGKTHSAAPAARQKVAAT